MGNIVCCQTSCWPWMNPRFRLRTQLYWSFGMTTILSVAAVCCIAVWTTYNSAQSVEQEAQRVVEKLVVHTLGGTAQYVAETLTKQFQTLGGVGSLLAEATRDRYVGYPDDAPGYEQDWYVPFRNTRTQANAYPIIGGPELPLDWQLESNLYLPDGSIRADYSQHYYGNRSQWYDQNTKVTTSSASYFFQGACNPSASSGNADYLRGCTPAHNNASTGGMVQPTTTNRYLQEKARDLQWALKPLWESHVDIKQLGVYFANEGAGAALTFPGQQFNAQGTTYTSIGCDWLDDFHVPMGGSSSTTASQKCHAKDQIVTTREYNPLERAWCRDQVQRKIASAKTYHNNHNNRKRTLQQGNQTSNNGNIFNEEQEQQDMLLGMNYNDDPMDTLHFNGPYLDALSNVPLWVIALGQAVFDRRSNNFLACTLVDVTVQPLYETLRQAQLGVTSQLALVRFNPTGDVIVATQWNPATETTTTNITDPKLLLGVDNQLWNEWYNLVDFDAPYDPTQVQEQYTQTIKVRDGRYSMMHPIPPMPHTYDPNYRPLYAVVVTLQLAEALDVVEEMSDMIDADVLWAMQQIAGTGVCGILVMALVIGYIAASLTKPLQWMQKVASRIIDNAGGADLGKGLQMDNNPITNHSKSPNKKRRGGFVSSDDEDDSDGGNSDSDSDDSYDPNAIAGASSGDDDDDSEDSYDPNAMDYAINEATGRLKRKFGLLSKEASRMIDSRDAHPRCAPHTEVSLLVDVFETMMKTFSQEGAAEVASTKLHEVQHNFQWRSIFKSVYDPNNRMYNLRQLDKLRNPKKMAIAAAPAKKSSGGRVQPGSADDPLMGTSAKSHTSRRMGDGSQTGETDDISSFEDEHDDLGMHSSQPMMMAKTEDAALPATASGLPLEPLPIPPLSSINSLASFIYFAKALRTHPSVQTVENHPMWGHLKEYAIEYASLAASKVADYLPASFQPGAAARDVGEEEPKPPTQHSGSNLDKTQEMLQNVDSSKVEKSYLFWWSCIMIATPILATAVVISWIVATNVANRIPDWMEQVQVTSKTLELESIRVATLSRALLGEQVMSRFTRDLHFYTRLAAWLFFGGISHAPDVFTEVNTGAEQCKVYYEPLTSETCPFYLEETQVCDCAWQDPNTDVCEEFNPIVQDTRYMMRSHFEGQKNDADPVTGARVRSSFPAVDDSPANTAWWSDLEDMPGAEKGDAAVGYETTYDRVRTLAALTPANALLYNYDAGVGEEKHLASYVGMEADGMMGGWAGCNYNYADYPQFVSSESNQAFEVAPDLCPLGAYGYDCRCRGWYKSGKEAGTIHVTPPYEFSGGDQFAASATYPLIDPVTKEHVGQTLLDFLPNGFMQAVNTNNTLIGHGQTGFPFVLTPQADVLGGNTLVAPGYTVDMSSPIGSMILPQDGEFSENRLYFDRVVVDNAMKSGGVGSQTFVRTAKDGVTQEEIYVSYAPVNVHSLDPIDSTNFAAGCHSSSKQIYSLGLAVVESDLALPFNEVQQRVNDEINQIMYISVGLMAVAIILVIYMTYSMSLRVSQPVIVLIEIVRSIKNKTVGDDLPRIYGGSWEILSVYDSLEKLCKIVRFSNAAFLAGDRQKSYRVMQDALDLFVTMGNQKALGVANNNIASMMLQEIQEDPAGCDSESYFKGVRHFEEAIRIGLQEAENAVDDEFHEKGNYIKQLANRYFNRGMFFVMNNKHPQAPWNIVELGISDITEAKRLDEEAIAYWIEHDLLLEKYAVQEFETMLRRARGILYLLRDSDGKFQDVYGFEELMEQAQKMIDNPEFRRQSKLFDTINKVGRQQQIDDLRIQHELYKGNTYGAARMAARILVEDEYVIDTVLLNAATAINQHYPQLSRANNALNFNQFVNRDTMRAHVSTLRKPKNVILCLDHSSSMSGDRIKRALKDMIGVYEEHCMDKDHVAFVRFNQSVDDRLWFPFGRKGTCQEEHLKILSKAKDTEGGGRLYFALNRCITIAQESDEAKGNDTFIIVHTHGEFSWDNPSATVINRIVQNNKKQGGSQIHVIIVGYDVARPKNLRAISTVTEQSMFVDAKHGIDEIDNAFGLINDVIGGTAITMEAF